MSVVNQMCLDLKMRLVKNTYFGNEGYYLEHKNKISAYVIPCIQFLSIQISFKLVALFSRKISFSTTDRHISRNFKL